MADATLCENYRGTADPWSSGKKRSQSEEYIRNIRPWQEAGVRFIINLRHSILVVCSGNWKKIHRPKEDASSENFLEASKSPH